VAKYNPKNNDKKTVEVIQPDRTGKIGDTIATLKHSKKSKRYSLTIDGDLNISSGYNDCMFRANQHKVVWDDTSKDV